MNFKIPRTLRLDPLLDAKLSNAAKTEKQTKTQIVRDALTKYLNQNDKKPG